MIPAVAIYGRQNVGKSTLVNRLMGAREAIADSAPGVTRDRVEREVEWQGRRFRIVDTGGVQQRAKGIERLVAAQAERAVKESDLILFVVDARTGPTQEDLLLARALRRVSTPVLVVANKADSATEEFEVAAFSRFGLGDPTPVSALHGRGSGDLLDRIVSLIPDRGDEPEVEGEPAFALIGRPNVGKSSLFNRLVGEERSVVYELAGTTRDAVDALVSWPAGEVRFVDTAGFRRTGSPTGVDYYSLLRAERAIERADVAVLVLDATEGFTTEDKRIAARVLEIGRALILVSNKWDLVDEKEAAYAALREDAKRFADAPIARISALRGTGVHRLPQQLITLHGRFTSRASTSATNRLLKKVQDEHPGPVRYRYVSQVSTKPPSFVLFGGRPPSTSYQRYLENQLREELGLEGVPIRLRFRAKDGADRRAARRNG